jgi:thioredoxin-like negative regulator of GroEL
VAENIRVLTAETFAGHVATGSGRVVLVFRQRCPNCQVLIAVIERYRTVWPDLDIVGVDADEDPGLLEQMGVSKVPTVLVFRNGEVAARRTGVMTPSELRALIASTTASRS